MMKISVVVVLALMLPGLLGYALAAPVITTSPVAFVTDGADGFEELEGPKGITAVTIGSSTYALAASYSDNGVQIMDITDPFNPVPIAAVTDGADGFEELEGARDITTVTIGSSTYAIVTASADHGIQIINITDPSNPTPASHISSIPGIHFNDPREVTTVTIGSSTYALVAASGSGVHIIDITDPSSPVSVAYVSDAGTGFDALGNSRGITTTTIGSSTYAIVAAFEGAVQIMDITDPSAPTPVGSVHDSQDTMLRGAIAVTTFTSGSSMYALVAAQTDDAVQILNITDLSNPDPVAFVKHGVAGFDALQYPETIATVTFGSSTYALVAAFIDGIQIIDVTNPSSPTPAASVHSFDARFDGFPLPEDMVVTEVGSRTYALVASNMGNGIQIIDVDLTYGPVLTSAALNEETGILEITFMDTVDTTPASTVDLSGLTIHDSGQSVSLAGATLRTEADSAVISIELTEIQSRSVAAMASPRLDISSSAVADTLGNPIELSLGSTITVNDDVAPEIVSVIMDTVTGILEITFSDRIDVTPAFMVYTGGMTLRDSGQSVSLAGATLRTEADSAVISIELTEGQRQSITTPVSPLLDVIYYGVADTDGNPIEASSDNAVTVKNTNEAEPPAFQSADYTTGDSQLAITFSKPLNGTIHLDRLHVRDAGQSSGGVTMTGAAGRSVSGDTLTITLVASQVATIGSLTTPQLDVDRGAVFDLAGIGITDTPDQPVILINTPPTVDAGQDQAVNEDTQVTLSGTATGADGDLLTYLWSHDQATDIIINNSTSLLTTFTAPQVSSNTTFTFTLTASDGNATGSDTVSITVLDIQIDDQPVILINTPPTVDAGQDQAVNEDTQVTLSGTATGADGDPLTYLWSHDQATDIIINNSTSLLTTFTAPQVSSNTTFTFTLTASDGNATGSDTVSITVLDIPIDDQPVILINTPPTVDAGQDQAVNEDTQVTLSGTATGADGDLLTYLWTYNSTTLDIALANATSASTTFTAPRVDSDTAIAFTLTANDDTATSSDSVIITVTAPVNLTLAVTSIPAGTTPEAAFVTTWQTTSANEFILIPVGESTGTYTVTWGDASIDTDVSGHQMHTYKNAGTYTVSIYGDFSQIYLPYYIESALKLQSIEQWGDIRWESMRSAFSGATNMVYRATDAPDLSDVTDTSEMFMFATSFNGNLSTWDVSHVTDMRGMFDIATAFNGDISSWNVSGVTDMSNMFLAAWAFTQNLGDWYIVLDETTISDANTMLAISAQNAYLDGQNPVYTIDLIAPGGDKFRIVNGSHLATRTDQTVVPGQYNVTIKSTGSFGTDNSKIVGITVSEDVILQTNSPPSVKAGPVQTVQEGSEVSLNGTATDHDKDIMTYLWTHNSTTLDIALANATSASTTFTAPRVDSDTAIAFTLTANDDTATSSDSVIITVTAHVNSLPSVKAGPVQTVQEGSEVSLNGTATDHDKDIMTYLWTHNSTTLDIALANATSASTTFTAPRVDSDTAIAFTLTANDDTATSSDSVIITVTAHVNSLPSVKAGPAQTVQEGSEVSLNGTATDHDKDVMTYLWTHNYTSSDITLANATSASTTFTAPRVDSDTAIAFTLTANDDTATSSDSVIITVTAHVNSLPSVKAGPAQTVQEGSEVSLSGSATDHDKDVMTYLWSHDQATDIIINNSTSLLTTFTAPQVSSNTTFTFTLTASDGNATGSDTVSITVLDVPADDQLNSTNTPMSNTVVLEPDEAYGPRDIGQVTLSGVTPGVIDASWAAPSEAPADYRIRWAKTDESYKTWTDFSGNAFPAVTSQTITDLEEGETYKVIVRARYGGTSGDWSGNVIITVAETTITVAETVANTPATGSPVISGTIQVRQTLTADASGIADVDGMTNATLNYQWMSSDGVTDTDIAEATISRYVLATGDQGRVIKVRVTFTDDAGYAESLTSAMLPVAVTSASTVPGVPTGLSVLPGDSGALNVSWQTPISDGGSAITGYTIQWKAAPGSWTVPADVSEATATGITHTITGLTDGTPYTVRVIATNQIGNGEPTTESTATSMTPQQLGPRDIGRVTLSSTTPGVVDASWEAPSEVPVDYRVSWAKVGESYLTWTDLTGNAFPTATSQTIADLEEGETYKVTVRARYGGTSGDWSADAIIIIITAAGS